MFPEELLGLTGGTVSLHCNKVNGQLSQNRQKPPL